MILSVLVRFIVLVILALVISIGFQMAQARPAVPPVGQVVDPAELIEAGREVYVVACVSCHGVDYGGVDDRGPSIRRSGTAAVDFYVSSGRMPMDDAMGQSIRKDPALSQFEQDAVVAYLATVIDGPEIPDIDVAAGDLALGQQLYTLNCAGCHNSAGSGGALGNAIYAPPLYPATALQVAEAIRAGPGAMPAFNQSQITDEQLNSIVRYVEFLDNPRDRGGLPLGRVGPVPEGMVAWIAGMGLIVLALRWIGTRT